MMTVTLPRGWGRKTDESWDGVLECVSDGSVDVFTMARGGDNGVEIGIYGSDFAPVEVVLYLLAPHFADALRGRGSS